MNILVWLVIFAVVVRGLVAGFSFEVAIVKVPILCTARAAPNMLSLKSAKDEEVLLAGKCDAFATRHAYRAAFQFLTFAALVGALVAACQAAMSAVAECP